MYGGDISCTKRIQMHCKQGMFVFLVTILGLNCPHFFQNGSFSTLIDKYCIQNEEVSMMWLVEFLRVLLFIVVLPISMVLLVFVSIFRPDLINKTEKKNKPETK